MIDPEDKQTQALPLEQPKRGRGRPATGKAMTPAEKQKAYRQRLAEQKNNQVPAARLEKVRSTAAERIEQLEQQLADAIARAELAEARADVMGNDLAIIKARLGKAQAAKTKKSNVTENEEKTFWNVESKAKGARKWKVIGQPDDPFHSLENAENFAERLRSDKSAMAEGWKYRVVQAKAPE